MKKRIVNTFKRPEQGIIASLGKIPTATLSDAMNRSGAMCSSIKGAFQGARLAGPAYTVRNFQKDNLMSHYALKHARPGDILVVDNGGYYEASGWGELMSTSAKARGLGGIVVDGGVRDREKIEELQFPVFSRCITPEGTVKMNLGEINYPVNCGGVAVRPGDIVVGDDDGVVVIRDESAKDVLETAKAILEKEAEISRRLGDGETIFDMLNLGTFFTEENSD